MYCSRCKKDDVSDFHRCFVYGFKLVKPRKNPPNRNSLLARKLAKLYEEAYYVKFPGGIDNACINHDKLNNNDRSAGGWGWHLGSINNKLVHAVHDFGSQTPASKCKKHDLWFSMTDPAFPWEHKS